MSKTLRIIEVIADSGPGGGPQHIAQLVRGLAKRLRGARFHIISPHGWLSEELRSEALIHEVAMPNSWEKSPQVALRSILAALEDEDSAAPTILHAHGVRAGTVVRRALKTRQKTLKPVFVYTEHLWTKDFHLKNKFRELLQFRFLKKIDRRANAIIAVSDAVADFLLRNQFVSGTKLHVIHNGIPDTKIRAKLMKKPSGQYRIGTIGTLYPIKGFRYLIEALLLILQNFPKCQLEIIGDGPEKAALVRLIQKYALQKSVILTTQTLADPRERMAEWDLFVSSSLSESFGLAIGEAMSIGLPVVATHVGGIPELVTYETGRLVQPGDQYDLAKMIIDLLPQDELRHTLGSAGRERISQDFSMERMIATTQALYERLLSVRR